MACVFCGVGDETATNHANTADCVAALNTEIARLRNQPAHPGWSVLDGVPKGHEQQSDNSVAPKLALQR
jgi:hypothetical protein